MPIQKPAASPKTIIWAVDPFEKDTRPNRSLVNALRAWIGSAGVRIQPVYVLSAGKEELEPYLGHFSASPQITPVQKALEQYIRDIGLEGALPPKVIVDPSGSVSHAVDRLLEFADAHASRWIVVSSHGRSGLGRLLLGSFAETLLTRSRLPILFLTHLAGAKEGARARRRILFTTDFSKRSRYAYLRFLRQAKSMDAEICLFHSISLPSFAGVTLGPVPVVPEHYFEDQESWAKAEGEKWIGLARSRGVEARLLLGEEGMNSQVGKTILDVANREEVDLIAMASVTGALGAFVIGSVAREVFRANRFPVWVYGPKAVENVRTGEQASA